MKGSASLYWLILFLLGSLFTTSSVANERLTAAVDPTAPWVIFEDSLPTKGINVRIIKALESELKRPIEVVQCPWARCLNMLEAGKVDLMVNLFRIPEREKHIYFVEPNIMQDTPKRFYLALDSKIEINDYQDLIKLTIGQVRDAFYFAKFDQDESLTRIPVVEEKQLINMLVKGRIDTFIGTQATVDYLLYQEAKAHLVKKAEYRWQSGRKTYIGISKKSSLMKSIDEFNKMVARLKSDGVFEEIEDNPFSNTNQQR